MYQNLDGTLNSTFSVGKGTNSASFRVVEGVLQWSDYTTNGVYYPMSNIDDKTTGLTTTWSSDKVDNSLNVMNLHDISLTDLNEGETLVYDGTAWVNKQQGGGSNAGSGISLFPLDIDSDISGYEVLSDTPSAGIELDEHVTCNNNKVLIDTYATSDIGLGGTNIEAGIWDFNIWGFQSLIIGNATIVIDMYKRTALGVETLLFSVASPSLSTSLQDYSVTSIQQPFSTNPTDRLVMKVYGKTTNIVNTTIHYVSGGTEHYSYVRTPLLVRHNDLVGLQGGQATEYYHLTSDEHSNVPYKNTVNEFIDVNSFPQVKIGEGNFNPTNPESLLITIVEDSTNNPVTITGTVDNFLQVSVKNESAGTSGSSDIVCIANNGSSNFDTDFGYIDMGINGSGYTNNYVGHANDGYLFTNGANLCVGTTEPTSDIVFFTNGADSYANEKMRIGHDGLITCQDNVIVPDGTDDTHAVNLGQLNTKQDSLGSIEGIVKGDGLGAYTSATSGTDYLVSGNNVSDLYNDAGYLTSIGALSLDNLTDVSISIANLSEGQTLKYNGSKWVNGQLSIPTSAGLGVNLYPCDTASDISGYMTLEKAPLIGGSEVDEYVVCNNNKVLIDSYVTDLGGIGVTTIDAGVWDFNVWGYCSAIDHSRIITDVYKRSTSGTETLLFSSQTGILSQNLDNYLVQSVQPVFTLNATDRLVFKVSGQTESGNNITIHFINGGNLHYSHVTTPLILKHNDLAGLQGGSANEYYHLTSTQVSNLSTYLTSSSDLNASNISSGTLDNARLSSSVTLQGNTFNGVSQLVQTNGSGYFPALNGSLITNLSSTQVGLGNVPNTDCTDASNISSGTLSNLRLASTVTLQGNTFNGVSQLVQTNGSGYFPALNGSLITGLTTSQLSGTNTAFNEDFETTASNIKMDGSVSVGSLSTIARADHIHPSDTTREVQTNKVTSISGSSTDVQYPSAKLLYDQLGNKVTSNTAITGATNTKITYDAKGLVTAGTAATTADISASTNKNYVSDAGLIVLGNTSGTNTGDETASTIKTKLGITTLSGSNTGDQTITLTSDVTGSGTGSFSTTIANNVVTNAKMAQAGANTYKGNATGSTANASDVATNTAFNQSFETVGANIKMNGAVNTGSLSTIARADHIHPVDTSREPTVTKGNLTESTSNILTVTGGTSSVIGSGTSIQVKQASTSQSGYLTSTDWNTFNGKLSSYTETDPVFVASQAHNITAGMITVLNNTSGTNTGDETASTIKTKLGITTLSGSNTGDQTITLTSDITGSGTGSFSTTIANNVVTNAKMAQAGANTYKGNATGSTANLTDVATNTAFNKNYTTTATDIKSNGTQSLGSLDTLCRADHVHPLSSYTTGTGILAINTNTQSITQNVATKVTFPTESQDNLTEFANSTFTSLSNQTVLVSAFVEYTSNTIGISHLLQLFICKNGAQVFKGATWVAFKGAAWAPNITVNFPITVATNDTIMIYTQQDDNAARTLNGTQTLSIIKMQ